MQSKKLTTAYRIVERLLVTVTMLLLFVVVASTLAFLFYLLITENDKSLWPWLALGSGTITVSFIVKGVNCLYISLREVFRNLKNEVQSEFDDALRELFNKNYVTIFIVAFSLFLFERHFDEGIQYISDDIADKVAMKLLSGKRETLEVNGSLEIILASEYYARIPIFFKQANFDENNLPKDRGNIEGYKFVDGVKSGVIYDPDKNKDIVNKLVESLIPCGSLDEPVILKVEGYASSEPYKFFKNVSDYSDDLNLKVGNKRGASVFRNIKKVVSEWKKSISDIEKRLIVKPETWLTFDDMVRGRQFDDRPRGQGKNTQALAQDMLTRSAHIKITSPGICAVKTGGEVRAQSVVMQ